MTKEMKEKGIDYTELREKGKSIGVRGSVFEYLKNVSEIGESVKASVSNRKMNESIEKKLQEKPRSTFSCSISDTENKPYNKVVSIYPGVFLEPFKLPLMNNAELRILRDTINKYLEDENGV